MAKVTQLSGWIKDYLRSSNKDVKVMKRMDNDELAHKLASVVQLTYDQHLPVGKTIDRLGNLIMVGQDVDLEAKLKVGYALLYVLVEQNKLEIVNGVEKLKNGKTRETKVFKFLDIEWLTMLLIEIGDQPKYQFHSNVSFEKPDHWNGFFHKEGGALVHKAHPAIKNRLGRRHTPLVMSAINAHQDLEWRVNTEVLEIVKASENDDIRTYGHMILDDESKQSRLSEDASIIRIADSIGIRSFWEYMFYDNRGRLNSSTAYFRHDGSKLSKALHLYAEAKPLGRSGWFYLLMHAANCFGEDKLSLDARFDYATSHLSEWMLWAEDPINNKGWQAADDHYNFLAAILDIKAALDSGDKYLYESSLPIAIDMTCSGLQILTLASLDHNTADLCNVGGLDQRGDYYMALADHCYKDIDDTTPQGRFWLKLKHRRRAIFKRPGMVYFYSCGAVTMGEQLFDDFKSDKEFQGITLSLCLWLSKRIYKSCKETMPGPTQLMQLFVDLASAQSELGEDFQWVCPYNKFPVMQNYKLDAYKRLTFRYKGERLRMKLCVAKGVKIDKDKVKTAASPNVVHSLDAQLVSAAINRGLDAGYTVSTIHDSFSTHAGTMGMLFEDVRSIAVSIFKEDVIKSMFGVEIERGDADIHAVYDNQYFAS